MRLKVTLKSDVRNAPGRKRYDTEVNAGNFKEIALVLKDLKRNGLPIDKALKEFNLGKSDWEIALFGN